MVDVFISYSRTDLAQVSQLATAVEAEGYDVWWDADLPPHLSYGDVITAKIGVAKAAIVVWSRAAVASEWVRAEADMARNQKKLVQTALDNVMPPLPFNQIQFAELGDWRGEPDHPGWRKVKASLAELCGRAVRPGPHPAPGLSPPAAATAPTARAPKWPLYAGIGVGAVALAFAADVTLRDRPASPAEAMATPPASPASPVAQTERSAPAQPGPSEALATTPASAPAAPIPDAAGSSSQGMVFPDSGERLLKPSEIASLGPATLEIARNEIYARKGRRFRRTDLRAYFSQYNWYRPTADEVSLNPIEQRNVALLRQAEARYGQ